MARMRWNLRALLGGLGVSDSDELARNPEVLDVVQPVLNLGAGSLGLVPHLRGPTGGAGSELSFGGPVTGHPTLEIQAKSTGGLYVLLAQIAPILGANAVTNVVFWRVTATRQITVEDVNEPPTSRTVWWEGPAGVSIPKMGFADKFDSQIQDSMLYGVFQANSSAPFLVEGARATPTPYFVPPGWWFTMQMEAALSVSFACIRFTEVSADQTP